MEQYKILRNIFIALILLLSHIMCAEVAFTYRHLLCMIEHAGFSAPADVAFFNAIPYAAGILICAVPAYLCHKKQNK